MKHTIFFSVLFLISGLFVQATKQPAMFDKNEFYTALSSDKIEVINAQLSIIRSSSVSEKDAYEGALLMKKSGIIKSTAKEKLSLFKAGRSKLEAAIAKENNNIEYRFLRFIIQEQAPKIVKYKNDLASDGQLIRTNFKSLSQSLQQVILDYNKTSKILKIG